MKKKSFILIGIVVVILAIIVAAGIYIRKNKKEKFLKYGVETTATITKITRKSELRSSSKRNSYILEITFFTQVQKNDNGKNQKVMEKDAKENYKMNLDKLKPQMGELVRTEVKISGYSRSNYNVGDNIQVLYLKHEPKEVMIKDF